MYIKIDLIKAHATAHETGIALEDFHEPAYRCLVGAIGKVRNLNMKMQGLNSLYYGQALDMVPADVSHAI